MKLSLAQAYMYQLARALLFMHQLGIMHRDLKPDSTLANSVTRILKLADFGSAKQLMHAWGRKTAHISHHASTGRQSSS